MLSARVAEDDLALFDQLDLDQTVESRLPPIRMVITPYQKATHAWAERVGSARAQSTNCSFTKIGAQPITVEMF